MSDGVSSQRITLRTIGQWLHQGRRFAMLTCYDATTARWLWRGGIRCVLVGDTAAEMILGHDSTLPVNMDFMLELTAAVRRGAPDMFVMADMPFGSYQGGDDAAMQNAMAFLKRGDADAVKLEVDASFAPLVGRMSAAGVPVVAHLGSLPQHMRQQGRYRAAIRTQADVDRVVDTARQMLDRGAVMLLLEAVPAEVAQAVVAVAEEKSPPVPVIGCGAGPACHGHVVVLHDLLGLTDWHPPFAPAMARAGELLSDAAGKWVDLVAGGQYLQHDHPYRLGDGTKKRG